MTARYTPTSELTLRLDDGQRAAVDAALAGDNMLITGPAGTGKSVTLKHVIFALTSAGREVAVTASTGIAALRIGGSTVHSFLGTRLCSRVDQLEYALECGKINRCWTSARVESATTLVVDEVSMLTGDYLDMIEWWARDLRGDDSSFGGLQVIFVGDFLQLPPVVKREDKRHVRNVMAFDGPAWRGADVRVMSLRHNHRQVGDAEFVRNLSAIRIGFVTPSTRGYFAERVGAPLEHPVRLYATNRRVDAHNAARLREVDGDEREFRAQFCEGINPRLKRALIRDSIVPERLRLRIGARVLLCRNDYHADYRNGQTGVVTAFGSVERDVLVRLDPEWGGGEVRVRAFDFEKRDARGRVLAWMRQLPLKLGWAVTVHKSQGMTLGQVSFDPDGSFERGQVYTALSRVRRRDGLSLESPLLERHVTTDPRARAFYARKGGA